LTGKFDGYFFAGIGGSPNRHAFVPLQNHMARERAGEFDLGENRKRVQEKGGEQSGEKNFSFHKFES
jgi:hypothetical protein